MILTDAGPLIALVDRRDRNHERCRAAAQLLSGPMLTAWPAFTEAMYLLGSAAGWSGQDPLWQVLARARLVLVDASAGMRSRMHQLLQQYADLPMDLADASLVALAEERSLREVFTLDRDFRVYRLPDGGAFRVVP